ncbi:GATA zinc finger domain-containing protein 14-like isoform X2 [Cydia strobilella]|uniref:GATA zinc finger domain-containing protein 14-like isoform X2 n=1 Tax=Cydia strobilella TaxID=1100964 RepID=UPI003006E542
MWRLVFVCLFSWAGGHSGRAPRQDHHGRGWDIRLAVPGKPGNDYPTLGNIPRTTFSCAGRKPGYYADQETNCQAFRVCTAGSTYGFQSFLCPNGTLFNQAVFVCDWWMNVKCEASQKFFNNNEKFGNLKLGPQLMKDIKKMITHPMRNPIDKGIMKGNLVVMQDYKPPSGQLFPNSALIASVDRTPSNVFVPPKITQQNFGQTNFIRDTSFAGSTPSPSYIPFDVQLTQADAEVFQRQRQNGQQWQSGQQFQNGQHWQNGQQLQNSQQWQNGQQLQNSQQLQSSQQWQNGQQLQNSQQLQNNQQWQNGQQWQNNRQNSQSGNPFGRLVQPTTSTNNNANTIRQNQLSQTQLNPAPTTYNPQNFNNQRIQGNRQNAQYTANKTPVQWNSGKQAEFGVSLTKQQFNHNSNQASQQQNLGFPKFSSDVKGRVGNEAKENLALVFSLLANSINAAKAYGNIAQQNALSATPTQPQFQNVNEEELARITNQISQLTSSQYSGNNQNGNLGNAKIVSTSQTTTSNSGTQQAPTQFTNNLVQNSGQSGQLNVAPQQSGSFYSSQFQFGNGFRPVVSNDNQNQVYSGQLYQLPVPQVTEQIYNKGSPAKLVQADNVNNFATEAEHLYTNQHSNAQNNINQSKQSSAEVEIVQSHSLPVPSPAKLQVAPDEANFNSQESSQAFINNFLNSEGISAQVQDNIIGTIPHPLEKNKLVTYKKDQSYSFYTRLDGNGLDQPTPSGRNPQLNAGSQQNAKLIQANDDIYQLIPSVGYQLEDEKEQEKILNAFNINEFGSPKSENNNNNEGYILPTPANRRSDVLTTNVDFSVTHPFAKQLLVQRKPNAIYDGPSSYSAPQGSIGFLDTRQQILQNQNLNARLEQFDINSNGNGYPPNSQRQFGY